jgi:hypothetical protein
MADLGHLGDQPQHSGSHGYGGHGGYGGGGVNGYDSAR